MNKIAELPSKKSTAALVGYDFSTSLKKLVQQGDVDCCIVSTEDGFSPLGASKRFFSSELGVPEADISSLADWNRFSNPDISLIGFPSKRENSNLKGLILAASGTSQCYEQFASAFYSKPYRDFYYNVAYESIAYATKVLGAKKIAISHLSASGHFHKDIATCVVEALAHFCDIDNNPNIFSFLFFGCCIHSGDLSGIKRLNLEGNMTKHRNISTQSRKVKGYDVISLDWRNLSN